MTQRPDRTAAARMRAWRLRRRLGIRHARVYIDEELVPALVDRGLIDEDEASDPHLLAERLGQLLEDAIG